MSAIVSFESRGDYKKTYKFLEGIKKLRIQNVLDEYGKKGVEILSSNTPVRTGRTAASWGYNTVNSKDSISIEWYNTSVGSDGKTPIVILIIKGHGTKNGGFVPPNDFVSSSMENLFSEASDAVWKAVESL